VNKNPEYLFRYYTGVGHGLLRSCEGGHSKDIDEAVRIWNESRLIGGEPEEAR
jgi:hypothetical protein